MQTLKISKLVLGIDKKNGPIMLKSSVKVRRNSNGVDLKFFRSVLKIKTERFYGPKTLVSIFFKNRSDRKIFENTVEISTDP